MIANFTHKYRVCFIGLLLFSVCLSLAQLYYLTVESTLTSVALENIFHYAGPVAGSELTFILFILERDDYVPHHVLVVYGNLYCSGTLLRSKIVITTAGCMTAGNRQRTFVKVGGNSITGLGQVIPVLEIKIHEYFRYYSRMDNDIAMLVLKHNVAFNSKVHKVLLGEADNEIEAGLVIEVTGWASQNLPQKYANMLLRSDMVIMEREDCIATYRGFITPSNYCAKFQPERRVSDIGGPATHKQMLVGILSFGALSEHKPRVAVFTNITYFHKWILLNTKRFLEKYCLPPKEFLQSHSNPSSGEQVSRVLFK